MAWYKLKKWHSKTVLSLLKKKMLVTGPHLDLSADFITALIKLNSIAESFFKYFKHALENHCSHLQSSSITATKEIKSVCQN